MSSVISFKNVLFLPRTLRFRWFQGKIPESDFGPEWALDNVYIGMACPDHCNGHGYCLGRVDFVITEESLLNDLCLQRLS